MHRLEEFKKMCKQYTKEEFIGKGQESKCYQVPTDIVCDNDGDCDKYCYECIADFCKKYNIKFKADNLFTKEDLKVGMIVELRSKNRYFVMDKDKLLSKYGNMSLASYNNDLEFSNDVDYNNDLEFSDDVEKDEAWDIIKVFKSNANNLNTLFQDDTLELLWEREIVKEMTLAEIEEQLGYKIKLKE